MIFIVFAIGNLLIALEKPIWLDEAATLIVIENLSPFELINKFYAGIDTHPPLYFVLASLVHSIFASVEVLRILSFIMILIALYFNYLFLKALEKKDVFFIYLIFFVITNYSIQYISFEIRPYSLYFLLFSIHLFLYTKLQLDNKHIYILYIFILTLLLYTHYFSLYYLLAWAGVDILINVKNKFLYKRILVYVLPIISFLPWLSAVFNQFEAFGGVVHHKIPSFKNFQAELFNFFRYLSIPVILLMGVFLFQGFRYRRINGLNTESTIYILIVGSVLMPLIFYGFSQIELAVFTHRYFIPSFIGVLIFA
jgi:uncharacterized membrane protein